MIFGDSRCDFAFPQFTARFKCVSYFEHRNCRFRDFLHTRFNWRFSIEVIWNIVFIRISLPIRDALRQDRRQAVKFWRLSKSKRAENPDKRRRRRAFELRGQQFSKSSAAQSLLSSQFLAALPCCRLHPSSRRFSKRAAALVRFPAALRQSIAGHALLGNFFPNATRFSARSHINSRARSALQSTAYMMNSSGTEPTLRISKPRPSPKSRFAAGTRTFSKLTSRVRAARRQNRKHSNALDFHAVRAHGTRIIDCWRCFGADSSFCP